jgi:oligopeptide transport system ATP-binding protein
MTGDSILAVRGLTVRFRTGDGLLDAVKGIDLDLFPDETVAIVGESGSGKSQAVMALMGLVASNGVVSGSAKYRGAELIGLGQSGLNRYRGTKLAMIFQEPMTSLDPLYRVGDQMALTLRHHGGMSRQAARARSIELLRQVWIPSPERRIDAYPHELSGGQRQRVMIAMALANDPDILIADEPTTALDVTIQAEILELLADLQRRRRMAVVFITHDLGIVRRIARRVYVMRRGEVVETGPAKALFAAPKHPYTQMLLAAEPEGHKQPVPAAAPALLEAKGVDVTFRQKGGFLRGGDHVVHAVRGVDVSLKRGETLGVVGESGSGKSTLGRAVLHLVPASGTVRFEDRALLPLSVAEMRPLRRSLQLVFQDPFGSLSPRMTVGGIVTEGLLVHEPALGGNERDRRAAQAMEEVGLDAAARNRYPHEFSGGQRQRIAIARAIILKPKLVVLDEPTSALDRTVQKQIVNLLRDLQQAHGLSYLFISHDLAVVRAMADRILVMREGQVVEEGPAEQIVTAPREAYTQALMKAAFAG